MSTLRLESTTSESELAQLKLPPQLDADAESPRRSGLHVLWIFGAVIYFIVKIVQLTASLHGWTKTATVLNALVDFLVVPSSHWIAANERRSPGAIGRFFAAAKERFDEYVRGARERLGRRRPLQMVDPEQLESLGRPSTPPTAAHARVSSPSPEPEPIHATAVEIHEETPNLTHRTHHAAQEIPVPLFVRTTIPTSPNSPVSCPRCSRRPFPSYDAWVVHCVAKSDHHFCQPCGQLFQTERELENHRHDPTAHQIPSPSSGQPRCKLCKRDFVDDTALRQHIQGASHPCRSCNRTFGRWKDAVRHFCKAPHAWCFACCEDLRNQTQLNEHCDIHHRNNAVECPLCSNSCADPRHISLHLDSGEY